MTIPCIKQWFTLAVPNPTDKNRTVQLGCHYEEVAEMALAHAVSNAVEAAYRRGDLFEKRTLLMQQWADFCGRVHKSATVTKMPARKTKPAA